jgi:DNA-binding CsgD family transcriptional regulator
MRGWRAVAEHMERVFRDGLSTDLIEFGQEDMQISVIGDLAWAVFDSWSTIGAGAQLRSFDTRILRRIDGAWKIVFNSFIQREIEGVAGSFVGLDGKGRIVWASRTALRALEHHSVLEASLGRLRARRPEWNKVLQASILQSARHHGFFETHKVADQFGGPARYPVVLGRKEDGGVVVVHFSIRDCLTYVRVSGDEDLDRRLQFARTVFGLSEGQIRVARRIAMGESLTDLAASLSIRLTTARTHLSRIYDKTGVRSQTALVRLLLSVG